MTKRKATNIYFLKAILFFLVCLSATKSYSSSDWWSGSEKQSYNKNQVFIGTKLYMGEGELILSCNRHGIMADITLYKSRLNPGIIFEIIVDNDGAWIKNANRPEYNNSFSTFMFKHLIGDMKKGRQLHIKIDGHRYYSASLNGFTKESKKLNCI